MTNKNLLTTIEASKIVGFSATWIAMLCSRKKIKATKIGRDWVISKKYLDEYMNSIIGNTHD